MWEEHLFLPLFLLVEMVSILCWRFICLSVCLYLTASRFERPKLRKSRNSSGGVQKWLFRWCLNLVEDQCPRKLALFLLDDVLKKVIRTVDYDINHTMTLALKKRWIFTKTMHPKVLGAKSSRKTVQSLKGIKVRVDLSHTTCERNPPSSCGKRKLNPSNHSNPDYLSI